MKIQLKIKTEYSFGKTYAPLPRIIEYLRGAGVTHAGIVDNNTIGHVPFYNACKANGIVPMLGWEGWLNDNGRACKVWFLAKNTEGLAELYKMITNAMRRQNGRLYAENLLSLSENVFKFAGDCTNLPLLQKCGAYADFYANTDRTIENAEKRRRLSALPAVTICDNYYVFKKDKELFNLICTPKTTNHALDLEYDAGANAEFIAAECAALQMPKAQILQVEIDLESAARAGAEKRRVAWNADYERRLQKELKIIKDKDFCSYFAIVSDLVAYAKNNGILVGPARGSAAGSLLCYLLGITELDPLPLGLLFERFIDESRNDLPDIDLDFPDDKRPAIFDYARQKYGRLNVAKIAAVSRFKLKSALNIVVKNGNLPKYAVEGVDLDDGVLPAGFLEKYPTAELALRITNHASHVSTHAAGLLICNEPIHNYAAVDKTGLAYVDKESAENLGLLKIDVLGLRTLTILSKIPNVQWYSITPTDNATFDLINTNKLCGIFQLEARTMRRVKTNFKVKTWHDLAALIAIARPGPIQAGVTDDFVQRKLGKQFHGIHPAVDALLSDTYGLPIYQEQTIALCVQIGGFSAVQANAVRKAISKHGGAADADFKPDFMRGAAARGLTEPQALSTWNLIAKMAAWQMNKSHAYAYALLSFWTAYAKCHHPAHFAAAALNHAKSTDAALALLREMLVIDKLPFVPFDYATSEYAFSVQNGILHGGFAHLRDVTLQKAKQLLTERNERLVKCNDLPTLPKPPQPFISKYQNLTPLCDKYAALYANPAACGIGAGKVFYIGDLLTANLPHPFECVFLGTLQKVTLRNENEPARQKYARRTFSAGDNVDFLDLVILDDTAPITARLGSQDYVKLNGTALAALPLESNLLIRAVFFYGNKIAHIKKWRTL